MKIVCRTWCVCVLAFVYIAKVSDKLFILRCIRNLKGMVFIAFFKLLRVLWYIQIGS